MGCLDWEAYADISIKTKTKSFHFKWNDAISFIDIFYNSSINGTMSFFLKWNDVFLLNMISHKIGLLNDVVLHKAEQFRFT